MALGKYGPQGFNFRPVDAEVFDKRGREKVATFTDSSGAAGAPTINAAGQVEFWVEEGDYHLLMTTPDGDTVTERIHISPGGVDDPPVNNGASVAPQVLRLNAGTVQLDGAYPNIDFTDYYRSPALFGDAPATTLLDDEYFHWDPATPDTVTIVKGGLVLVEVVVGALSITAGDTLDVGLNDPQTAGDPDLWTAVGPPAVTTTSTAFHSLSAARPGIFPAGHQITAYRGGWGASIASDSAQAQIVLTYLAG